MNAGMDEGGLSLDKKQTNRNTKPVIRGIDREF
jgi:hypothetical protein